MTTSKPIAIFGCGNLTRSDDGVGVVCAQRLRSRLSAEIERGTVEVYDAGTNGFEVMYRARGAGRIIVIDACKSGAQAGQLFEVPGSEVEIAADPGLNAHAFRWDHAIWLARKIFADPPEAVAYLIEAENLGLGLELSAPVLAAVDRVVERICERVGGALTIRARDGNLYFDREVVDRFLSGVEGVAILDTGGGTLAILPVHGAGGLLLKQKNLRGDRVVQAIEVLRAAGLEDAVLSIQWDPERGALIAKPSLLPRSDNR